jgi:ABC-type Fe3+-hydroxamate transport system substrate-binding protein
MEFTVVTDQMGLDVSCPSSPQRIVSLVPSQTELLFDLGLADRIVGITKFCIHPKDKASSFTKIGGTKKFNFEKIDSLKPDLIIGNKEENYQEGIEQLKEKWPVWMSDIFTLEDSLEMMRSVGKLTQTQDLSNQLITKVKNGFDQLLKPEKLKSALYFIWQDPHMVAGSGTFINEMLCYAGFDNLTKDTRYPELTDEQIQACNPEYILLSSEPYPFKDKHIAAFQKLCPSAKVMLVDGEMFSWYGSRLIHASNYFNTL